jgi:hypothetical protein
MSTYPEQHRRAGWSRTRWLVLGAVLVAIAVAVVLVLVYSGGGGGGGGGGYSKKKRGLTPQGQTPAFPFFSTYGSAALTLSTTT